MKFTISNGDPYDVFSIEETSGQIITRKIVDRELNPEYNLTVIGRTMDPPYMFDSAQVTINIEDLNDEVPTFSPDDLKIDVLYIAADSPIGHLIHKVECHDKDDGINGRLTYELSVEDSNVNSMFDINPISGVISLVSKIPDIYYPKYEGDEERYRVKVVVKDSGVSPFPLSNSRNYDIIVIRNNTHTPIFDYSHSEISVSEEMPLNTEIIALAAIDSDFGPAGQITYSIVEEVNNRGKFGIFPDGRVYLKDYLDRENQAYHSIRVKATDFGTPSRSSDATVVIYVMDENDNDPVLIPRLNSKGEDSYIFYLAENEPGNSVVGRITAVDADIGRNAELSYKFGGSLNTDFQYFTIDSSTGFIWSTVSIDREDFHRENGQDSMQFDVIVSDNGIIKSRTASVTITIEIVDRNDNAPEFSESSYGATISEGANINTEIITVQASDIDKGVNGDITYRIDKSKDSTKFTIDSKSGVISLIGNLDRETKDEYVVIVIATDGGEPALFTKTEVRIKVSDINDEVPVFSRDKVSLNLSEDTKVGQIIHTFEAHDKDTGENGRIRYAMGVSGSIGSRSLLTVNPLNGQLTLSGSLDRESKDSYEFNILAIDNGKPQRTGSVAVIINVNDVNDNSPIFTSPNILVSVAENTPIGTIVHRFDATDPDQGNNGTIEYSVKNTEGTVSAFTINSATRRVVNQHRIRSRRKRLLQCHNHCN